MKTIVSVLLVSLCLTTGCTTKSADPADSATPEREAQSALAGPATPSFGDFWYQGKAELTSYTLEQARYGEIHKGHAVLIFVTEDFSREKQVKLDRPDQAGDDRVNVLKLNLSKKFNTGIYPYSLMTSVFTPIQRSIHPQTLKITTTAQEWCGHTFTQMNLKDGGYRVRLHSYFESEGDQELTLDGAIPEDEIWTTIRLNSKDLPTGEISLIPGAMFQRLRHAPLKVYPATATLKSDASNTDLMVYTLSYPDFNRLLTIRFKGAFPHEIESWEDTYRSGFGRNAEQLTTRATRMKRIWLDYWSKNSVEDEVLRRDLGLD